MPKQKLSDQWVPWNLIRNRLRLIWSWSAGPKAVRERCRHPEKRGLFICEGKGCGESREVLYVDHITPVVGLDARFDSELERAIAFLRSLFVPPPYDKLQGLCFECHKEKTDAENKVRRMLRKLNKEKRDDGA